MTKLSGLIACFVLTATSWAAVAGETIQPVNVKVITDTGVPKNSLNAALELQSDVQFYHLSLLKHVEAQLSFKLSSNPHIARQQALNRINLHFSELKRNLHNAITARTLISDFGIRSLPAAIIDDEYVIYGSTDPQQIISRWNSQRQ